MNTKTKSARESLQGFIVIVHSTKNGTVERKWLGRTSTSAPNKMKSCMIIWKEQILNTELFAILHKYKV